MIKKSSDCFKKTTSFLLKIRGYKLILMGIAINLILSVFFSSFSYFVSDKEAAGGIEKKFGSILEQVFWIIIIAPFFETLLFQYVIIENLNKKFRPYLSCFISALLFGLSHTYNIFYFVFAFFSGIIFAVIYYISSINNRGFIYTFLTHVIYNSIAFIINKFNV